MNNEVDKESIRTAMDQAWRDHQHTRDQTWKALQFELVAAAGIVGANWQIQSPCITFIAALFIFAMTFCGIQITLRHRNKVEICKFRHIMNCEEILGLHRDDLICNVRMPGEIKLIDVLNPWKGNTALFILRMHFVIAIFSLFLLVYALVKV